MFFIFGLTPFRTGAISDWCHFGLAPFRTDAISDWRNFGLMTCTIREKSLGKFVCTFHWFCRLPRSPFNVDVATDIRPTSNIEIGVGKEGGQKSRYSIVIYITYVFLYLLLQYMAHWTGNELDLPTTFFPDCRSWRGGGQNLEIHLSEASGARFYGVGSIMWCRGNALTGGPVGSAPGSSRVFKVYI